MYELINLFLFGLIYIISLRYIFTPIVWVKDPLNKRNQIPVTGVQQFLLFILFTSIFSLGSLMANRMLFNIFVCLIAIFVNKNRPVFNMVFFIYILFILWLIVATIYSPQKVFGFRVFLKYLYPFVVFILVSKITTTPAFAFKAMKVVLSVGIFGMLSMLVIGRIPFINNLLGAVIFWWPAILDFMPLPICIALAYYSFGYKKKYLLYVALFILPSLLMTNRTGILVASVAIVLYSLIYYKLKSIPYVIAGVVILIGSILYIPSFREKMFKESLSTEEIIENRETLTEDDIDSSGRFAMWEWSLKNYYEGKELTGSGLGVLQERFYSLDHPFGTIRIVHNDYVQLLCDTGLIGVSLYVSIFVFVLIHSILLAWNKRNPLIIRFIASITGPSLISMGVASYTDNVVNYSLMTLSYGFAMYGLLIGLNHRLKTREIS